MMSPFFRSQPPPMPAVSDVGEFAPVRTAIGFSGGGGFHGLSARAMLDVNPHSSWLGTPAAGTQHITYWLVVLGSGSEYCTEFRVVP
jgi:hypothetical protein